MELVIFPFPPAEGVKVASGSNAFTLQSNYYMAPGCGYRKEWKGIISYGLRLSILGI